MRIFHNLNVDFLGKRKYFYMLSTIIFVLGLISILARGLYFGIDFKGGTEVVLGFDKPIDVTQIRKYLTNIGLGNIEVKTFGAETGTLIRTELQEVPKEAKTKIVSSIDEKIKAAYPGMAIHKKEDPNTGSYIYDFPGPDTATNVTQVLFDNGFQASRVSMEPTNTEVIVRIGVADIIKENLRTKLKDNSFKVLREDRIGPKIGAELKRDAVIAVVLSLLGILIYLGFRFKLVFATGAVLALFHDVLLTLGIFSLLYDVIPGLNLEIDLTVIAAFLTLIGYSINDTVIVFDRVRETMRIHKGGDLFAHMNEAINKTMSRTVLTSGTTLLTVFILLLLGGEVIRAFAFTLFFGIIIGTYSSIFVASAFVLDYALKKKINITF
ncbi:MAG: protein translocase subunit SecF [Ignavibacteriales bacterium]|nr:Protein translocase subunit SecF [Ignavibacteriaceae bacterium]MBW7874040.1 protein translocase subunit SecF [Ignavibacteria bacterium]MCZ2143140.1 protein translocase subunit SecF [Ignavibacteriales bacterium]OQY74011.1 MAG: protein translocase subunit SecF [Ignavibacteriales bacterium UTCHB3]WKZ72531.1 MAG: protein translocase subunit SecF [Ignavibacteriaceae bacterium]